MQVDDEVSLTETVERLKTRGIVVQMDRPMRRALAVWSGFATGAGGMGYLTFSIRESEAWLTRSLGRQSGYINRHRQAKEI